MIFLTKEQRVKHQAHILLSHLHVKMGEGRGIHEQFLFLGPPTIPIHHLFGTSTQVLADDIPAAILARNQPSREFC
jgi:hypothetical protein